MPSGCRPTAPGLPRLERLYDRRRAIPDRKHHLVGGKVVRSVHLHVVAQVEQHYGGVKVFSSRIALKLASTSMQVRTSSACIRYE